MTKIRKSAMQFARVISWVGHPLVFMTVSIGSVVAARLPRGDALSALLILFASMILPIALLLFAGVRSGWWTNADISAPTERKRFYPLAILLLAIGVFTLWSLGAPHFILRGALVTVALLALAAITNLRIKLSLHMLFAFFCSVILFRISPAFGGVAFGLSFGLFWARLYLQRHNVIEMLSGTLLGLGGGMASIWWP